MGVLRQDHKITKKEQKEYALNYNHSHRDNYLYSFVKESNTNEADELIGYGGLTHCNKKEKSAEISFLLNPNRKKDLLCYTMEWLIFLVHLREMSKMFGITTWRSETYMNTDDPTRAIHVHDIHAIFGAKVVIDKNGNGRQEWKI